MIFVKLLRLSILFVKLKAHRVIFGKKIRGRGVLLKNHGKILIGNRVSLKSHPEGEPYRTALYTYNSDACINIGDNCNLNGTMIYCVDSVEIADYCIFGPGVVISDNDSHRVVIDVMERRRPSASAPVRIKKNVWVGMRSLILKGVTIGDNSIIAANSVVTSDIPGNSLAGGIPAKVLKKLE